MKPIFKVLLATAAVVGIAKVAKANGKCQNHRERKMAMLDKIRKMDDQQYATFKEDLKTRNFKKIREQFKSETPKKEQNP